jgi:hypothetical protein
MKSSLRILAGLALLVSLLGGCFPINTESDFDELIEDARDKADEAAANNPPSTTGSTTSGSTTSGGTTSSITSGSTSGSTTSSSGVCSGGYVSVGDAQLDAYCGAAYSYRCQSGKSVSSPEVQAVCQYYNDIKEPGVPSCPYCN